MGASASKSRTKSTTNVVNEAINKCPSVVVDQRMKLEDVKFRCLPRSECDGPCTAEISQGSVVDAECVITNAQESMATLLSKSEASAQAGIGLAVANTRSDILTNLKNSVENKCGDAATLQEMSVKKLDIEACSYKQIQSANTKSMCKLGVMQKLSADITNTSSAKSEGMSPMALFWAALLPFMFPILSIIVVLILVVVAKKFIM
jgi:hypothetical protein